MELTDHQQIKLNEALNVLAYEDALVINGSAGVGKTFMVNQLIKSILLEKKRAKIVVAAPTNMALEVIENKIDQDVTFNTVHQALMMKQFTDNASGQQYFKPSYKKNFPLWGVDYLIIDEASMVGKDLFSHIKKFTVLRKTKVVYLGDDKQLKPVKEKTSPVFHDGITTVTLTEIVRQKEGNSLIDLSLNLGGINNYVNSFNEDLEGYLYTHNEDKIIHELALCNGSREYRYLAWTNEKVREINRKVRTKIYGSPNRVEVGETLIFNSPFLNKTKTSQEVVVTSLNVVDRLYSYSLNNRNMPKSITIKCYIVKTKQGINFPVVHEDSLNEYNNLVLKLKESAIQKKINWAKDYYGFINQFADILYAHAITVHKAQGSTFNNVIISLKDIQSNFEKEDRDSLLYTSLTRASKLAIIDTQTR